VSDDLCVCGHRRVEHAVLGPRLRNLKRNVGKPHACDRCDCRKFEDA
jgi:hypothetical protein